VIHNKAKNSETVVNYAVIAMAGDAKERDSNKSAFFNAENILECGILIPQ